MRSDSTLLPAQDKAQLALSEIPFFSELSAATFLDISQRTIIREIQAHQSIVLENDWAGSVYFILDGWVKISTHSFDGKEIILNLIGKGEIFGEMAILDGQTRCADVVTITSALIISIPDVFFLDLLESQPKIAINLAQLMAKRLRQVNHKLKVQQANSLTRLADAIVSLARSTQLKTYYLNEFSSETNLKDTIIPLPYFTHHELAALSGLARETVTRVLNKLIKQGLIERSSQRFSILKFRELEKLAQNLS